MKIQSIQATSPNCNKSKLICICYYVTKVSVVCLEQCLGVEALEPKRQKIVEVRKLFQNVLRHGESVYKLRIADSVRPGTAAGVLWVHNLQTQQCIPFMISLAFEAVHLQLLECYAVLHKMCICLKKMWVNRSTTYKNWVESVQITVCPQY